jgi:hypothetical protein
MNSDQEQDWGSYRPYGAEDSNFMAFPGFHPGLFSPLPTGGTAVPWLLNRPMEPATATEDVHAIAMIGRSPIV